MRGFLFTIVVIAIVAVGLRMWFFDVWVMDDDAVFAASVAPTLSGGDTVVIVRRRKFDFGDLIRCKDAENLGKHIVGRVMGIEGDVVELDNRIVRVNGVMYDADSSCPRPKVSITNPTTGAPVEIGCDVVSISGGTGIGGDWHYRGKLLTNSPVKIKRKYTVARGMVFLLSDNRDFHDDSRDFGQMPVESCDGRIAYRLWSKAGWSDDESRMTYIH